MTERSKHAERERDRERAMHESINGFASRCRLNIK